MRSLSRMVVVGAAGALLAAGAARAAPPIPAQPIPENPRPITSPVFTGAAAEQNPVATPAPPRHPFMAPNGRSSIHVDAYQSDANAGPGPLGLDLRVSSTSVFSECASLTFDSKGRIETICVGLDGPRLALMDPQTLTLLAVYELPPRIPMGNPFNDFSGGGYFYLDDRDRAVVSTTTRHVYVIGQTGAAEPGFRLEHDYDVSGSLALNDKLESALPDWSGRIWFVSAAGVVGTIDPASGAVKTRATGEGVSNSFAVDESGGVYVVTDTALYRFDADGAGAPAVSWREAYPDSGVQKPGQSDAGSGTTPTVMGGDYVAITDNADPMDVVVYRRARSVSGSREVCRQPVFKPGASATDNSLNATDRAMVVENNYGYSGPAAVENGGVTSPGFARVDIDADGGGCHLVWTNDEIGPSVVPKLSLANGLVYAYTKGDASEDPWFFTAIDFRTGRTVFKRLAGRGLGFNNNYAPITLGPDGTAYVGALGGLVRIGDKLPPPGAEGSSRGGARACSAATGFSAVRVRSRGRGRRRGLEFAFARRSAAPVTVDVLRVARGRRVVRAKRVALFRDRTRAFRWRGRVRSGYYVARLRTRVEIEGRAVSDERSVALRRSRGRWSRRPDFVHADACGVLRSFALDRPVWGGTTRKPLGVSYRLGAHADGVTLSLLRGRRVVRLVDLRGVSAGVTYRVRLRRIPRPPRDYTVRLQVRRGGRTLSARLTARRL